MLAPGFPLLPVPVKVNGTPTGGDPDSLYDPNHGLDVHGCGN